MLYTLTLYSNASLILNKTGGWENGGIKKVTKRSEHMDVLTLKLSTV